MNQGPAMPNSIQELHEGNTFSGHENSLLLLAQHQNDFYCTFELANFPFDTQTCGIDIRVPNENINYVVLQPLSLVYHGNS